MIMDKFLLQVLEIPPHNHRQYRVHLQVHVHTNGVYDHTDDQFVTVK